MKWQYLDTDDRHRLWSLGREGWELVSVVYDGTTLRFFFKKPVPDGWE